MPAVLGWVAVPLLSLYLAVYPALAALGARALRRARGSAGRWRSPSPAAGRSSELLRATVFTGYAWNPFAMVLLGPFDRPGPRRARRRGLGTYALSGLAVLAAAALAVLVRERRARARGAGRRAARRGHVPAPPRPTREGTLRFTLVQPDLAQDRLNDPRYYEANFVRLVELGLPREAGERRLVLWPESGLADYLRPGYPQRYYDRTTALGDPGVRAPPDRPADRPAAACC